MRILLIASILGVAACAGPAENEPHPFDKYMTNSNTYETSHDNAPPCSLYGCGQR